MANKKRPDKVKMDLVQAPSGLQFSDNIYTTRSIYSLKLNDALARSQVIQIVTDDKYALHQFKIAAKKLGIKLVFAQSGESTFIKPITISDDQKRLLLLLREPRTLSELSNKGLELHLANSLELLKKDGIAIFNKEKWMLTEKGKAVVKD